VFQVAIAVETKKKAVMDRHLELIVGQTERYSKMLASNLLQQQQQGERIAAAILPVGHFKAKHAWASIALCSDMDAASPMLMCRGSSCCRGAGSHGS
jgi:hypothetical protein